MDVMADMSTWSIFELLLQGAQAVGGEITGTFRSTSLAKRTALKAATSSEASQQDRTRSSFGAAEAELGEEADTGLHRNSVL